MNPLIDFIDGQTKTIERLRQEKDEEYKSMSGKIRELTTSLVSTTYDLKAANATIQHLKNHIEVLMEVGKIPHRLEFEKKTTE